MAKVNGDDRGNPGDRGDGHRVFDEMVRDDRRPKLWAEAEYSYLNRSARPEIARVRAVVEAWFAECPAFDDGHWLSRFRAKDDRHHVGAFFELCIHVVLLRQDFTLEREPDLTDKRTHPEFLARHDGAPVFYLECTVAAGPDFGGPGQKRLADVIDVLNQMTPTHFMVGLNVLSIGARQPRLRDLRAKLKAWLASLDPDEVARIHAPGIRLVTWPWSDDGWSIQFFPIPLDPAPGDATAGAIGDRFVGIRTQGGRIAPERALEAALKSKASRYGAPSRPYVVAVDAMDPYANERDASEALFGRHVVALGRTPGEAHRLVRQPNGFWFGPNGPKNRRVSAVLFCRRLDPSNAARARWSLWHNPWATWPLPRDLWQGPQQVPEPTGELTDVAGKTLSELLQLPAGWPEDA